MRLRLFEAVGWMGGDVWCAEQLRTTALQCLRSASWHLMIQDTESALFGKD